MPRLSGSAGAQIPCRSHYRTKVWIVTSQAWLRALIRSTSDVVLPTAQPCSSTSCTDPPQPHAVSSSTASRAAWTRHPVVATLYMPPAHDGEGHCETACLISAAMLQCGSLSSSSRARCTSTWCPCSQWSERLHEASIATADVYLADVVCTRPPWSCGPSRRAAPRGAVHATSAAVMLRAGNRRRRPGRPSPACTATQSPPARVLARFVAHTPFKVVCIGRTFRRQHCYQDSVWYR